MRTCQQATTANFAQYILQVRIKNIQDLFKSEYLLLWAVHEPSHGMLSCAEEYHSFNKNNSKNKASGAFCSRVCDSTERGWVQDL